jgi:hypothetical protein
VARDAFGDAWGRGDGFKIDFDGASGGKPADLAIGDGRYYVDGIMCENDQSLACGDKPSTSTSYSAQRPKPEGLPTDRFLVYLDVWERHVNWIEEPGIREVALGGPDTASRSRVVWRVTVANGANSLDASGAFDADVWKNYVNGIQSTNRGCLTAELTASKEPDQAPCQVAPSSRYRGTENQLYRIQIRRSGKVDKDPAKGATFIWSRDNGCLIYGVRQLEPDTEKKLARVSLDSLGRDAGQSLEADQWVELVVSRDDPTRLLRIANVYPDEMAVDLDIPNNDVSEIKDAIERPYLRRWDHRPSLDPRYGGGILIEEGVAIKIENGIQIKFEKSNGNATYQADDYWQIPARTATGNIEWPMNGDAPVPQSPRGEMHHFAPLAVINPGGSTKVKDLRHLLP